MYISNCNQCGKEFSCYTKGRKFCNRACYNDSPKPRRTEESKKKIAAITKKYYETASKEDRDRRNKSISISNSKPLTADEILSMEEVFSWGYVTDTRIVIHHAKIENKSKKILENFFKGNKDWVKKHKKSLFLPYKVQMWPLEKFQAFKEDALKYDHVFMEAKYNLGKKSFRSICDKLGIRWGWKEGNAFKESLPEKKMASLLIELGVEFTRERYVLNMKYRVDFMLTEKKVIEVHGDYWHANPEVFDYSKLSDMQVNHVARDMQRRKDFLKAGISLLEVWEKDINEDIESVKNKVKVYAEE